MKSKLWSILTIALVLGMSSCKKDEEDKKDTLETKGDFKMEFEHVWGPQKLPFTMNNWFTHPSTSDSVRFTKLAYYISNIILIDKSGKEWAQPESYHIVDAESASKSMLHLKEIPQGEYTAIKFIIGVDSARNTSGVQEGALSPSNGMFWSWNSGYIFIKAEGDSPHSSNNRFEYHIGGFKGEFNAIRAVALDFKGETMMVNAKATPKVHLMMNAARFWHGGIKIADVNKLHMPNANSTMMATNIQGAFTFDHLHN
jgi:hypothetical protein